MRLLPRALLRVLPALDEQLPDDPIVVTKLFFPIGSATWHIVAGDRTEDGDMKLFGFVDLGGGSPEWGYISLRELASVRVHGLGVERDLGFRPLPASQLGLPIYPRGADEQQAS
jgi:hypothetical protein